MKITEPINVENGNLWGKNVESRKFGPKYEKLKSRSVDTAP